MTTTNNLDEKQQELNDKGFIIDGIGNIDDPLSMFTLGQRSTDDTSSEIEKLLLKLKSEK